jgi:CHAD domain-containing protein
VIMREYVQAQTAVLLRRLAFQINRAARDGDADAVHDLRVSIRRLSRCLRAFAQFYPGQAWKKMRRRLADLMDACGTVRDLDIAIELLGKAGLPPGSPVVRLLLVERRKAEHDLLAELRRWKGSAVSRKWKAQLGL